jgi:hypothetical protein
MNIESIETFYKGRHFDSRLEARWAVFFDSLQIHWIYEPGSYWISEHHKYTMPEEELKALIESGKINAAMLDHNLLVKQRDVYQMIPRKEQPEYLKYAHLQGVGIGLREASRKYGISPQTIRHWIKRELILIIGERTVRGGCQFLIDEADVAYCVEVRSRSPGKGHWLFRPNGTPRK